MHKNLQSHFNTSELSNNKDKHLNLEFTSHKNKYKTVGNERREVENVILRYGNKIRGVGFEFLKKASIAENAAILPAGDIEGVNVSLLDLSSNSATGTFKDWLACVTIAYCLENGINRFVTQSSGNTGNALLKYANQHGISVILLYTKMSRYKIDPVLAHAANSNLVEVDKPEPELKRLTAKFSELFNLPWLPTFNHQIESNKLRAYFYSDYCSETGKWFDWHVQALSSGYGIFGFYHGLEELATFGKVERDQFPTLLAVQQEAVCPFARYLRKVSGVKGDSLAVSECAETIEPTLFRSDPSRKLLHKMQKVCGINGGSVIVLQNDQYYYYLEYAKELIESCGVSLSLIKNENKNLILEQSGVIGVAGFMQKLKEGFFKQGDSALIAITGGAQPVYEREFIPQWIIEKDDDDEKLLDIGHDMGIKKKG